MMYFAYGLVDRRKPLRIRYVGCTNNPYRRLGEHNGQDGGEGMACYTWIHDLIDAGNAPHMVLLGKADHGPRALESNWIRALWVRGLADLNEIVYHHSGNPGLGAVVEVSDLAGLIGAHLCITHTATAAVPWHSIQRIK